MAFTIGHEESVVHPQTVGGVAIGDSHEPPSVSSCIEVSGPLWIGGKYAIYIKRNKKLRSSNSVTLPCTGLIYDPESILKH